MFMPWQWKRMTSALFRETTSLSGAGHERGEKEKKRGEMERLVNKGRRLKVVYLNTKKETGDD